MVDPVSSTEPVFRLKLDPGEPGVVRTTSPDQAASVISAQERRNLQRLTNQARMRGEEVVSSKIEFRRAIVDGKPTVIAGRTTVTSREADRPAPTPTTAQIGSVFVTRHGTFAGDRNALEVENEDGDRLTVTPAGREAAGLGNTGPENVFGVGDTGEGVAVGRETGITVRSDEEEGAGARVDVRI
ncbi:MAG: hypothetical protein ACYTAF_01100 [Planctomycetota bacterium]|jgi:hypothetical protein